MKSKRKGYEMTGVPMAEASVLNTCEEGTIGWIEEQQVIGTLLELCDKHGYGRIPQLTRAIEDLWRNPEKLAEYEKARNDQLKFLRECRKV